MSLKSDFINILGNEGIDDDNTVLTGYAQDQSFVTPCRPELVAFPTSVKEVEEIVKRANRTSTPLVPFSSGLNFHGATIPERGGIIVNLSRMNKILSIDEDNWFAVLEPGVTYEQLQNELGKKGLRAMIPLGVPPQRTVLSSVLERDPSLAAASFEYGNDLMLDTEVILPEGDLFRTGLWASGGRPGAHLGPVRGLLYRFWTGAQGTLGIMTKMVLQVEYLPNMKEILFIPFSTLEGSLDAIKQIQRNEIGLECFLLNNFNLAALFCQDWHIPEQYPCSPLPSRNFDDLRSQFPPWVLILCLSGSPRLPEEKIAYEKEALLNLASQLDLQVSTTLPPLDNPGLFFTDFLLRPWDILKKFCFKGSVHDLSFKSPLKRVPEFQQLIFDICEQNNYPLSDLGGYLLPLERGRAVHLEFDFHCDLSNSKETEKVKQVWLACSETLISKGALFDRPYGPWAEMTYKRTGTYTKKLQELKQELDPNNIMNPGKLCFT